MCICNEVSKFSSRESDPNHSSIPPTSQQAREGDNRNTIVSPHGHISNSIQESNPDQTPIQGHLQRGERDTSTTTLTGGKGATPTIRCGEEEGNQPRIIYPHQSGTRSMVTLRQTPHPTHPSGCPSQQRVGGVMVFDAKIQRSCF